ncbi:hypothetical protein DI272_34795 [Streptomyces sp. Act143]|nr:hypothetical protein DI272_34795 [Streptomyces sp. Act143]
MVERPQAKSPEPTRDTRRQRAGIAAFLVGMISALAFFAFWPGLPHVIDWGAILVAIAVGSLARWACQAWMAKTARQRSDRS